MEDLEDRALANSRANWLVGFKALRRDQEALWAYAADRRTGVRLIFLTGDSVVLGYGRRGFAFDPAEPESALQHIDRLINLLAGDGVRALYSGAFGLGQIAEMLRKYGRPGDVLLFQDWGWRPRSYDATYANFASVASLAAEFGMEGIVLNAYARVSAPAWARFDLPCSDRPGTPNDAIAAVADRYAVRLVDAHRLLGAFDAVCLDLLGIGVMHRDGIHPNGLGNTQLARLILGSVVGTTVNVNPLLPMLESALAEEGTHRTQRDLIEVFSRADQPIVPRVG